MYCRIRWLLCTTMKLWGTSILTIILISLLWCNFMMGFSKVFIFVQTLQVFIWLMYRWNYEIKEISMTCQKLCRRFCTKPNKLRKHLVTSCCNKSLLKTIGCLIVCFCWRSTYANTEDKKCLKICECNWRARTEIGEKTWTLNAIGLLCTRAIFFKKKR